MPASTPCEILEWDSDFFGFTIARVTEPRLDEEGVRAVGKWCEERGVRCLYFLADAGDPATARVAEDHGFHLVDVRLTFEHALGSGDSAPGGGGIRAATLDDLEPLRPVARESFRDTRFFADPGFPPERAAEMYERWLMASVDGPMADAALVAEYAGSPGAVVTCGLGENGVGQIGLVMVDPAAGGTGMGARVVAAALEWFRDHGAERVRVGTQIRNLAAQRLYQRAGFLTAEAGLWFHRWFET